MIPVVLLQAALAARLVPGPGDTLLVPLVPTPPRIEHLDVVSLGEPQVRLQTGQGAAAIWLVRTTDSVYVAALLPDSTPYWGDDLVIGLDTSGERAPTPQHDDFRWDFRRVLDSSVVYRGRNGRWEPPRADPDWRLGLARGGGGWAVRSGEAPGGWRLVLALDPAWLAGQGGRLAGIAFRIYDDAPSGWFAWPAPAGRPASAVEDAPVLWVPVARVVAR